ncbi:hypothetical protein BB934_36275 (plasmid) [Microvirga ossetica]|uniref:YCII-related domain-containing protein n=1 Tax=Microvirga ossetica TaxID=1882682 RepID=A0A1B2EUP7_9HYPH|nr:hypothetical protein BB934_36275 [Microvirga ossetica]
MFTLERYKSIDQIIKKNRFVATVGPIASEHDAKNFIAAHSDLRAKLNCGVWRVGQSYRCRRA